MMMPENILDRIIEECGLSNIVIPLGAGVTGGAFIFTIILSHLMNNKEGK